MKSTVNIFLGLVLLLMSSCEMPSFDRYPGERLNQIPKEFQGDWVSYELSLGESGSLEYKDTSEYIISKDGWKDVENKSSEFLSDSLVLSKYKDYYFLSGLDEEGWTIMVIERKGDGFRLCPVILNDDDKDQIHQYFSEVEVKKKKNGSNYYNIKTNEKEIITYFQKYLLKRYYLSFRVK